MKTYFGKPVDRTAIEQIPPPSRWTRWLKWILPATILAAFAFGASGSDGQSWQEMLLAWVLPNSIMAALLTAIARGKLLSVVTSFFSSPITSLNPLVGTGMVVGLLEAYLRETDRRRPGARQRGRHQFSRSVSNPATHTLIVVGRQHRFRVDPMLAGPGCLESPLVKA